MDPVLVEQHHGTKDPHQLGFDQTHQLLENISQRSAGRDHLEDEGLPVAQAVRMLARGDVSGNADQAEDLVLLVAQRHFRR